MDEGRNMCLIFPQLIELEGSGDEQREKREAFKPTYVHILLLHECKLTIPLDVISFMSHAC